MERKIRRIRFLTIIMLLALSGCVDTAQPAGQTTTVTDLLGRRVSVPVSADRIIAIGPGALRLYVYAGEVERIVGVEQMETEDATGKPYLMANPSLGQLPVIGLGGPNNAPDPEKILAADPQVIFSAYGAADADAAAADELQSKTGIPVVVVGYGTEPLIGPAVTDSLQLIGLITGQESKAQAAVDFLESARQDLDDRTRDILETDKPTVYVGALGSKGAHGIESTKGRYDLLDLLHAKNVVDETGKSGSLMIDKEQLLEWDPDFLFIDQNGYAAVLEDYRKNPAFYESLSAVKNGNVYSQLPYNRYSTNIDTALADAYYLGKVLFPAAFADIDPAKKADEIYETLLGCPVYAEMAAAFGEFSALQLGE
jgi:iron complex transport system substrate-binding protein